MAGSAQDHVRGAEAVILSWSKDIVHEEQRIAHVLPRWEDECKQRWIDYSLPVATLVE